MDADECTDTCALCSQVTGEHEAQIEKLQNDKRKLYELLVLGYICKNEYSLQKAAIDAELAQLLRVHKANSDANKKNTPGESIVQAAKKAWETNTLTQELVDLLIEKVFVYPDNRVEIKWKDNAANTIAITSASP